MLWVVNQVKRAHHILHEFRPDLHLNSDDIALHLPDGTPVVCYHSRFRLRDRVDRHADAIRLLKKPDPGHERAALGITTQVCEMSLDIDVDLLVTEACPVTSLVQRFGRCNRERTARPLSHSGEVLVYDPTDKAPYSPNHLKGVSQFIERTAGRDLSQADLEAIMQAVPSPDPEGDPDSQFLTSGAFAVGSHDDEGESFREGQDFNVQCVLPGDVATYVQGTSRTRPGLVVPVPKRLAHARLPDDPLHAQLPRFIQVAENGHYHPAVGYLDHPLNQW